LWRIRIRFKPCYTNSFYLEDILLHVLSLLLSLDEGGGVDGREGEVLLPTFSLYISPYILFVERAPLIAFFFIAHVNLFLLFLFVVELVVFYVVSGLFTGAVVCWGFGRARGIFIDSYDVVCQIREGLKRHHQHDAQSSV